VTDDQEAGLVFHEDADGEVEHRLGFPPEAITA
jgi:hypothetical protein